MLRPIIDPIKVTFGQMCNFPDLNLVTLYLCIHLQYEHFGTFANHKIWRTVLPQKSENVRPHSSNPIENVTPL